MIDDDVPPPAQKRASPDTLKRVRDAKRLVLPLHGPIGQWQAESIQLATAMERMRMSGRQEPGLIESVHRLIELVEMRLEAFETSLGAVPTHLAEDNRVHDARRALNMILDRLRPLVPKEGRPAT